MHAEEPAAPAAVAEKPAVPEADGEEQPAPADAEEPAAPAADAEDAETPLAVTVRELHWLAGSWRSWNQQPAPTVIAEEPTVPTEEPAAPTATDLCREDTPVLLNTLQSLHEQRGRCVT